MNFITENGEGQEKEQVALSTFSSVLASLLLINCTWICAAHVLWTNNV